MICFSNLSNKSFTVNPLYNQKDYSELQQVYLSLILILFVKYFFSLIIIIIIIIITSSPSDGPFPPFVAFVVLLAAQNPRQTEVTYFDLFEKNNLKN